MSPAASPARKAGPPKTNVRPLTAADLEAVIALDAAIFRRSRRGYMQKRLEAALRDPSAHIQCAVDCDGAFAGFILARVREGEFGREAPAAAFEAIGVSPSIQRRGLGHMLMRGLEDIARRKGLASIQTDASWRTHELLRFLDDCGFDLAPRQVLSRRSDLPIPLAAKSVPGQAEPSEPILVERAAEVDYGQPTEPDYAPLAHDRVPVRSIRRDDLPAVTRIDRKAMGHDRTAYFRKKFDEALLESAVSVSLVAEQDGTQAGFVMARVDFGEFGHTEPVAVLDTIGVDPEFGGRGIGSALISQLLANVSGLRIERVETEVAREDFALLRFLYRLGFEPSDRLIFAKPIRK
jgi:ribosomal protein S18 acetylase RimI-like enzyme